MIWTVLYLPSADDRLTNIWIESDNREAVTAAANFIDSQLGDNALTAGESREANKRMIIKAPLAAHFYVIPDVMKVVVFHVQEWK